MTISGSLQAVMTPALLQPCWANENLRYTLPRLVYVGPQVTFQEMGQMAPSCANLSYVYHLFDKNGELLYVGFTGNPRARWEQHKRKRPWWSRVDHLQLHVVRGATREAADRGARHWEARAIHGAAPQENRHGPASLPYHQRAAGIA